MAKFPHADIRIHARKSIFMENNIKAARRTMLKPILLIWIISTGTEFETGISN